MTYAGLDPDNVRDLAGVLRAQSRFGSDLGHDISNALRLADLADPIANRYFERSDELDAVADELISRAAEAQRHSVEITRMPTGFTPAYLRGLASFHTIDELTYKIDNWQGTDNDPKLDALISDRDTLVEEAAARQERIERAALVDQVVVDARARLHIDNQSGWTPWHDGKAGVTVEDAVAVIESLNGLTDEEIRVVISELSEEELDRLDAALAEGEVRADQSWGHHVWSVGRAPVAGVKGWGDTMWDASKAFGSGMVDAIGTLDDDLWIGPNGGAGNNGRSGFETTTDFLSGVGQAEMDGAEVLAAGSVPIVSNLAGCSLGDDSACAWLGVEIVLEVAGGFVVGRVVGAAGRVGGRVLYRVIGSDGIERILALSDDAIIRMRDHLRAVRAEARANPERGSIRWGTNTAEQLMPPGLPEEMAIMKAANATDPWSPINFQVGPHPIKLRRERMIHFLNRHHPDYYISDSATIDQSFFPDSYTIADIEAAVRRTIAENRDEILAAGGGWSKVFTDFDDFTLSVVIDGGHIEQVIPR